MAIVELQIREAAFLAYVQADLNRRRLPMPTLPVSALNGRLLDRIECTGCVVAEESGNPAGTILINASLLVHSTTAADARAAGSLRPTATARTPAFLQLGMSIALNPVATLPAATLQMRAVRMQVEGENVPPFFTGATIPLALPTGFGVQAAAIMASPGVIAIRLATHATDSLDLTPVSVLGVDDWAQIVPGEVFADQLIRGLEVAVDQVVTTDPSLTIEHFPKGGWWTSVPPILGLGPGPLAVATAELGSDKCPFGIEVSVEIGVVGRPEVTGQTLVVTTRISWAMDSLLCDIVGALVFNAIYATVVHVVADDIISSKILGQAQGPAGFNEIDRDNESITYQLTTVLSTPTPAFVFGRSEVNDDGLLMAGGLVVVQPVRNLQGSVEAASSTLQIVCADRSVKVVYSPPRTTLYDFGAGGPPKLFPNGVTLDPSGAWMVLPTVSNSWFDLALTFADPPGGRLPAGTATAALIQTDCGVRWIDLGLVPTDHAKPTRADVAEMFSQCMAISDRWGAGVMNLDWLVDPPYQDYGLPPVREWTVAWQELEDEARVEFVAINDDGSERSLGVATGRRSNAVQVTTDADETLAVRVGTPREAPAPLVLQRWISPFASVPIPEVPATIAAARGHVGILGADGVVRLVEFSGGPEPYLRALDPAAADEASVLLSNALNDRQRKGRVAWATTARVDVNTVATTHRGALLLGTAGPARRR